MAAAFAQWRVYAAVCLAGMALIGLALVVLVGTQIFETRFSEIGLPGGIVLLGMGAILILAGSPSRRRFPS